MKRIALFILTNLAVLLVLSVVLMLTGADRFITADGLNLTTLLAFSAIVGFIGSFFSLLISKPMAKWSVGARVINPQSPANQTESWLVNSVHQLADRAGIGHPEVAIYDGEPNAFATGAFKNSALVAVSTGLLASMEKREVEAVLGHEVAHIANGDMVTMTLMQGVLNTFVIFISRVVGYAVDKFVFKREEEGVGIGYFVTSIVCQILLGILASMILAWFSRKREFRADAGAAELLGDRQPMIDALARLGGVESGELPQNMVASGITGGRLSALFASHPPIEERIKALKSL